MIQPPDLTTETANQFVACHIPDSGWVVLCPWVQSEDGYWWRPHMPICRPYEGDAEDRARHYAAQLNAAVERGRS